MGIGRKRSAKTMKYESARFDRSDKKPFAGQRRSGITAEFQAIQSTKLKLAWLMLDYSCLFISVVLKTIAKMILDTAYFRVSFLYQHK